MSTERWYVSRKESSSHSSIYHSICSRHRFAHFPYEFRDMKDSEHNVANRSRSRVLKITKAVRSKAPEYEMLFAKCCRYDMRLVIFPNALWWLLECPACEHWIHSNRSSREIAPRRNVIVIDMRAKCDLSYSMRVRIKSDKRYERLTIIWKTRYDPNLGRA